MTVKERLYRLLIAWLENRVQGNDVPVADLCRDFPELLPDLTQYLQVLQQVATHLDPTSEEGATILVAPSSDPLSPTQVAPEACAPSLRDRPVAIPGYEILEELGRGGMGVVYKARQKSLGRIVALKMILAGEHAGTEGTARFLREAETIARLRHPHLIQVYEYGTHEGRPFFSLEYLEGGSLSNRLRGEPQPSRPAAQLVRILALAIQAAHDCGVVHRDLKPANILLAADGTPRIGDFGLAKETNSGMTATGAILGTPSYMAPEQADGHSKEVGPAADVYALGAILYECLTGRPPFKAATPLDTVRQVLERDPLPLHLLNPSVARDLEIICLHCLEKKPNQRYASAAALADDLQRFQEGESISVRSLNMLARVNRVLGRSQLDVEFHTWGTLLMIWAGIVLVIHGVSCVLLHLHPSWWLNWGCYMVQFLLMGLTYWRWGPRQLRPSSAAEQRLWSLWAGYVLSCFALLFAALQLPGFEDDRMAWGTYPFAALLTGLAFIVMGGAYLGRCYAFGLAFLALAMVMPWNLRLASLEFGVLWAAALTAIGLHLRHLGNAVGGNSLEKSLKT